MLRGGKGNSQLPSKTIYMSMGEFVAFSVAFVDCKNEQSKIENSSSNGYVCAWPPTAE